jgi:hypothetical protein
MGEVKVRFSVNGPSGKLSFENWSQVPTTERDLFQNSFLNWEKKMILQAARYVTIQELGEEKAKDIQIKLSS